MIKNDMTMRQAFKILGLEYKDFLDISLNDIEKTYKKLVREYHPDMNFGQPENIIKEKEEILKEINIAMEYIRKNYNGIKEEFLKAKQKKEQEEKKKKEEAERRKRERQQYEEWMKKEQERKLYEQKLFEQWAKREKIKEKEQKILEQDKQIKTLESLNRKIMLEKEIIKNEYINIKDEYTNIKKILKEKIEKDETENQILRRQVNKLENNTKEILKNWEYSKSEVEMYKKQKQEAEDKIKNLPLKLINTLFAIFLIIFFILRPIIIYYTAEREYKNYYSDGQIKEKGKFKDYKRNGTWNEYYRTGNIKLTGEYLNNEKIGTWKEYDYNGKLIKKFEYKNNKLNGTVTTYNEDKTIIKTYNEDKFKNKIIYLFNNGTEIILEGCNENGLFANKGTETKVYKGIKEIKYYDELGHDTKQRKMITEYETEEYFVDDKNNKQGKAKITNIKDNYIEQYFYKDGIKQGNATKIYENGTKEEYFYKNNIRINSKDNEIDIFMEKYNSIKETMKGNEKEIYTWAEAELQIYYDNLMKKLNEIDKIKLKKSEIEWIKNKEYKFNLLERENENKLKEASEYEKLEINNKINEIKVEIIIERIKFIIEKDDEFNNFKFIYI